MGTVTLSKTSITYRLRTSHYTAGAPYLRRLRFRHLPLTM